MTLTQLNSGGYSDDLRCAITFLSHLAPSAPLYGIGFSLGANILAKYLGEEGVKTPLKCGLILAAPWNFEQCVQPSDRVWGLVLTTSFVFLAHPLLFPLLS